MRIVVGACNHILCNFCHACYALFFNFSRFFDAHRLEMRNERGVRTKSQPPTNFKMKNQRVARIERITGSPPLKSTAVRARNDNNKRPSLSPPSSPLYRHGNRDEGKYIDIEIRIDIVDVTFTYIIV